MFVCPTYISQNSVVPTLLEAAERKLGTGRACCTRGLRKWNCSFAKWEPCANVSSSNNSHGCGFGSSDVLLFRHLRYIALFSEWNPAAVGVMGMRANTPAEWNSSSSKTDVLLSLDSLKP